MGFRLLVMIAAATLVAAAPAHAQKRTHKKPLTVQLLAINDFHGYLRATPPGRVSRTGDPEKAVPAGGVEYLATQIRRLKRRNKHTLVVAAGDLVGGSPLISSLFHDEPAIEAMNQLPLDISTVGNHEFDEGAAELLRLQRGGCHPEDGCRDGTPFEGADFRYLAANVELRSTHRTIFPPYTIRKIGGVKIGFIGETLKGTPDLIPPQFAARLRFRNEVRIANRTARQLKRRGVRAIVMLLHEGGFPVREDAPIDACPGLSGPIKSIVRRSSDDIDVFVTGHTHRVYNCKVDGRRVTSAGRYGRLLTRLQLKINRRTGDVVKTSADNWVVGQDVKPARDMTGLIAHYDTIAAPIASQVIGRLTRSAGRKRDRSGEYRLGSVVADAQRAVAGSAAAFVNPHIVRTGLPPGEITYGRAFTSQPFGSSLVTQSMTGGQIRELLKQQWCGRKNPEILQVSSTVSYTWSRSKAKAALGKPCSADTDPISDLTIRGNPVRSYEAFLVTVNTTLLGRGARFSVLHTGTGPIGGPVDVDAFKQYLLPSVTGPPIVPPKRSRINVVP
ncbi:MAG TPA: bifunctional metallophosphatase/5'-nucleotidase [Solirubrobacteraceae bacterium]|nr:bifunctional metallophosphatase/5'-nucleotidase [Solirubrobacteraceae bacterium]